VAPADRSLLRMVKLLCKNNGWSCCAPIAANLDEITATEVHTDSRNLLSKCDQVHTAKGSVTNQCETEANSLLILVVDTGIGIAAHDLARLGDPFFQAKALPDRQDQEPVLASQSCAASSACREARSWWRANRAKEPASESVCRSIAVVLGSQGWNPAKIETTRTARS